MKRISFILSFAVLFLFTGMLCGQNRTPVPALQNKNSNFGIYTLVTKVAINENDDEVHQKYASRINHNRSYNDWLFIDVKFPVLTPGRNDPWEYWVDDLAVRLEIVGFKRTKDGKTEPVALTFTQPLNPVLADGREHHVRFFAPPYILYRYITGLTRSKTDMRKRVSQTYILATVMWRGNPISYITPSGRGVPARRNVIDNMRVLREQRRSNYLENTLLPAEFTPWAGRSADRFESMKIDMQQRSR